MRLAHTQDCLPDLRNPPKNQNFLVLFFGMVSLSMAVFVPIAFFVECPFYDEWILAPIVKHILEGTSTFQDFWMLHNEHRIFFPKLFLSYWAAWTSWDMRVIPWIDLALISVAELLLYRLGTKVPSRPLKKMFKDPLFWMITTLIFSLRAVHTIISSFQFQVFLSVALTVIGISWLSLKPTSLRRWFATAVLAMVATYSFAAGVFFWVAVLPIFWSIRKHHLFGVILTSWISIALLVVAVYFYHYTRPALHPGIVSFFDKPVPISYFCMVYLGSIFYSFLLTEPFTAAIGFLGLVLAARYFIFLIITDKKNDPKAMALAAIMLFVIFGAFLTSVSRVNFGLETARSERYTPVTCFFWAALGVTLFEKPRLVKFILIPLLFLSLTSSIFHSLLLASWKNSLMDQAEMIREYPVNLEKIRGLYLYPNVVEESVRILKDKKLSVFNPTLYPERT